MLIPTCLLKLVELTLTIVCLVMHCFSYDLTEVKTLIFCSGTYLGYIVILGGELIGELILAPLDLVLDMLYSAAGVAIFGCCGGFIIYDRAIAPNDHRTGNTTLAFIQAILALITAIILFFDLVSACKDVDLGANEDSEVGEAFLSLADPYVDACWSATGGIMFSVCGALTIDHWHSVPHSRRRRFAQVAGGCALANAFVMAIDAILSLVAAHRESSGKKSADRREVEGQC